MAVADQTPITSLIAYVVQFYHFNWIIFIHPPPALRKRVVVCCMLYVVRDIIDEEKVLEGDNMLTQDLTLEAAPSFEEDYTKSANTWHPMISR